MALWQSRSVLHTEYDGIAAPWTMLLQCVVTLKSSGWRLASEIIVIPVKSRSHDTAFPIFLPLSLPSNLPHLQFSSFKYSLYSRKRPSELVKELKCYLGIFYTGKNFHILNLVNLDNKSCK